MIKEYKLKDGTKRYKIKLYLSIDSLTGEQIIIRKQGIKTKKKLFYLKLD